MGSTFKSDIQTGNNVTIDGHKKTDGSAAAIRIIVEPSGTKAAGAVSAVSGTTITLTTQKETVTVATTTSTKFFKGKDAGSLSDVTKGVFVMAFGAKQSDGSISAPYVFVNTGPGMQGQGQPPQGQPTRAQTPPPQQTRNQTPPPQPTRNQTLPPQPTRAQTPIPPSGQGSRPTPTADQAAQSNPESPVEQGANPLDQFVQWLLGLFKSR